MEVRLVIFLGKSGHKESDKYNHFFELLFMEKKRSQYTKDYKVKAVCLIVRGRQTHFLKWLVSLE